MSNKHLNTYTTGFTVHYKQDISRKQFIEMCEQIGCKPEPITRGGFLFLDDEQHGYKTMRLNIPQYPTIYPTVVEDWKDDNTILVEKGTKAHTFLKAFYAAPHWTIEELHM